MFEDLPERPISSHPNFVTPEGMAQIEAEVARLQAAFSALTPEAQADVARGWQRILAGAETLADLEPDLSGRVEELIDFVTGDSLDR